VYVITALDHGFLSCRAQDFCHHCCQFLFVHVPTYFDNTKVFTTTGRAPPTGCPISR
jgi:hypothetical protein